MITGITALTQLKKHQENWLLYRSTEESLKREKFLFMNNAGNYSNLTDDVKNKTLVESLETILSSQTSKGAYFEKISAFLILHHLGGT